MNHRRLAWATVFMATLVCAPASAQNNRDVGGVQIQREAELPPPQVNTPVWESLGGDVANGPDCVTSPGSEHIDCFVMATDETWWTITTDGTSSSEWQSLGTFSDRPDCVASEGDRINCLNLAFYEIRCEGLFSCLERAFGDRYRRTTWHQWRDGSVWNDSEEWGDSPPASERPECVSSGADRIDCFSQANDELWHISNDGGGWSEWEHIGDGGLGDLQCLSWGIGRIDCFANGGLISRWHFSRDGAEWSAWEDLGPVPNASMAFDCVAPAENRIDCFLLGSDGALWRQAWDGQNWTGWRSLGGSIAEHFTELDCEALATDSVQCVVIVDGRGLLRRRWDGSAWSGWENLGGWPTQGDYTSHDLDCTTLRSRARIDCFVGGRGEPLYHIWLTSWGPEHGDNAEIVVR